LRRPPKSYHSRRLEDDGSLTANRIFDVSAVVPGRTRSSLTRILTFDRPGPSERERTEHHRQNQSGEKKKTLGPHGRLLKCARATTFAGNSVKFDDEANVRGRLGLRIGTSREV
jgi:hypothetical protein